MSCIIIAFPVSRRTFSGKVKTLLQSRGYDEVICVGTAAEALREIRVRDTGLVISCAKLPDMYYRELLDFLPRGFSLLLLDSAGNISNLRETDVVAIALPIKVHDFTSTVQMMTLSAEQEYQALLQKKKEKQAVQGKKDIDDAKALLMERNHMSEPEAHRYIQKTSMDTGRTMAETAQMILLFSDR